MKDLYQYFVEGEDERRLLEVLKTDMRLIQPGKIQVLNVVQERLTDLRLRALSNNTILVFVFDTDTQNTSILIENIEKATDNPNIKSILCITQVKNIEDEIVRSTDISKIEELLNSTSKTNFKSDFIREKRLKQKLLEHSFDVGKIWIKNPEKPFDFVTNEAERIKI